MRPAPPFPPVCRPDKCSILPKPVRLALICRRLYPMRRLIRMACSERRPNFMRFFSRRGERGATLILVSTMLPLFLIPIVGLAIDSTVLYIVQAKLSSAADGAALGAGRLLGTNADTKEIAGEFLKANFPRNFWGS